MSIPVFKFSNNFLPYFSCKVTTGTYNLQSVMLNFKSDGVFIAFTSSCPPWALEYALKALSVNTQF